MFLLLTRMSLESRHANTTWNCKTSLPKKKKINCKVFVYTRRGLLFLKKSWQTLMKNHCLHQSKVISHQSLFQFSEQKQQYQKHFAIPAAFASMTVFLRAVYYRLLLDIIISAKILDPANAVIRSINQENQHKSDIQFYTWKQHGENMQQVFFPYRILSL